MYDRRFLATPLGKTAAACVAAMALFVALSSQIEAAPTLAVQPAIATVVLA